MAYYVYILASRRDGAIYVGITNDLVRRVYEHRIKAVPGFTSKYNITQLVWFEVYDAPISAISREKKLKSGSEFGRSSSSKHKIQNGKTCTNRFAIEIAISRFRVRASRAPE